jgi:hypothetical protein
MPDLDDVRLLELPRIESTSGCITPVHGDLDVPFEIARLYFLYDIQFGAARGGHAHRDAQQVMVAAMGSFSVVVDDGRASRTFELRQPHVGLYVPCMVWSELVDFASGSIAVVLASAVYDEDDYVRDYEEFGRVTAGARA